MDGYPVHDKGTAEQFAASQRAVVDQMLADPRAPVLDPQPQFIDTLAAAWRSGTSIGALMASETLFDRSTGEVMTPDQVYTQLAEDGIFQHRDAFYGVRDRGTYEAIKADVAREEKDRQTLAASGLFPSLAAGLMTGLADPLTYVPVVGAASKVRLAAGGYRMAAARGAQAGALGSALTEGVIQGVSQTKTAGESAGDIAVSAAFGMVLGVGLHAVTGARTARRIEQRIEQTINEPIEDTARGLRQRAEESKGDAPRLDPAEREWADVEIAKREAARDAEMRAAPEVEGDVETPKAADAPAQPASLSAGAAPPFDPTANLSVKKLNPLTSNTTDRIDDRLFGIMPISGTQRAVGNVAKFLRNPRLELMDSASKLYRSAIQKLDMVPNITERQAMGHVDNQTNFHGVYRELTADYTQAVEGATLLYEKNKGRYTNQDDFGKRVYSAVISDGRTVDGDEVVESAAKLYRKYFDHVLKKFREAGVLEDGVELSNAETYAPIVHLIDNIRNDSSRFIETHAKAFEDQMMSDWFRAADRKRMWDAQHKFSIDQSKTKTQQEITDITKDYGASPESRKGKIADARKKLKEEHAKGVELREDGFKQKLAELKGKAADENQTVRDRAIAETKLRERHAQDMKDYKAEYDKKTEDETQALIKERDEKIAARQKRHDDLIAKLEALEPVENRNLLRELTLDPTTARERAAQRGRDMAEKYYDGATKNAVVIGDDLPGQPGLPNVLKARKSALWQKAAADNGWVETNIFKLAEHYHRRAAADASLASVFKRWDEAKGREVGDIELRETIRLGNQHYDDLITAAREAGKPDLEAKLVGERNRQAENLQILIDMTRGRTDPNTIGTDLRKVSDYVMMYNAWRLMGGTVAASLTDPVNIALAHGLGNSLRHGFVPAFQNLKAAMLRVPTEDLPDIFRINRITGIVVEHQLNSRMAAMADLGNPAPSNKTHAWAQRVNKHFWDWTGLTFWTTFQKNVTANVTHARLVAAAQEGWAAQSPSMKAWLANLTVDEKMLGRFKAAYDAQPQKFSAGVPYGALDQWADADAARVFANALDREVHSVIITPTAGDKLALQATPIGQMVWQFRTFGSAMSSRMMSRQSALANMEGGSGRLPLFVGIASLAMAGTLVEAVKTGLGDATIGGASKDGKSQPFEKFIEKWQKTPGEALYNSLDRSGAFWLLTEPSNTLQKAGLPNIQGAISLLFQDEKDAKSGASRFGQRSGSESILGPSASLIEDAIKLGSLSTAVAGRALGMDQFENDKISRSDFARARRVIPFQNMIPMQQLLNEGHKQMGTIFDWPPAR